MRCYKETRYPSLAAHSRTRVNLRSVLGARGARGRPAGMRVFVWLSLRVLDTLGREGR